MIIESPQEAEKHQDLKISRSLTWRYVIALALVASLTTAAWLSIHLVISEQQSTAAIVNVSGRQRMLSQRTALFSELLITSTKVERKAIREKLKGDIELMARSHKGLIYGSEEMRLPDTMSAAVHAVYFDGETPLDQQVRSYIETVNELLRQDDDALTSDNELLQYIISTASTTLVTSLDKMVRQYQLEGEASVRRLQKAETVFWLVTLLLLVIEAVLIFHPFIKHVRTVIGKLQFVTDELKLHKEHLEDLVKSRTKELKNKTKELSESEEKFRLISASAHDAITIIGRNEEITYWNPAAERIFGYSVSEIMGKNLHDILAPLGEGEPAHIGFGLLQQSEHGKSAGKTFETNALRKDGLEFPIELSISALKLRNEWHALGIIRDITERKRLEMELKHQARIDYLTGVNNRGHFMKLAEAELSRSIRYERQLSLFMVDIDFFKQVNDTFGHHAGDTVLKKLAQVCREVLREVDIIGRVGGEEFAILLPETDKEEANTIAERLRVDLANAKVLLEAGGLPLHFTVSIGIASLTSKDDNIDVLISHADKALYEAKETGRNKVCIAKQ